MNKKVIIILLVGFCALLFIILIIAALVLNPQKIPDGDLVIVGTPWTGSPITNQSVRVIFLHHSTGENIWNGGVSRFFYIYNNTHNTDYQISELAYPSDEYDWANYPYDYWNIWINHGDEEEYKGQPTLVTFTRDYDVIVWKHCFPVGNIEADNGAGNVESSEKTLANYKLQYAALKAKMHEYPDTKFIVWTGAALIQSEADPVQAQRTRDFFEWVKTEWDEGGDNIYIFDFFELETEGGIYLKPAYSAGDSHPNVAFSARVAPIFSEKVIDVIEGQAE